MLWLVVVWFVDCEVFSYPARVGYAKGRGVRDLL